MAPRQHTHQQRLVLSLEQLQRAGLLCLADLLQVALEVGNLRTQRLLHAIGPHLVLALE